MKLSVLVDNNTIIDNYFKGEPALSFFIEDGETKILFDAGYSDLFIENASKLNIDLASIDYIVLSHGHLDHTAGLINLLNKFNKKPSLIAHPSVFNKKIDIDNTEIGCSIPVKTLKQAFDWNLSKESYWINSKTVFLGEIPRKNGFESKSSIGNVLNNNIIEPDYLLDDSAIVHCTENGLVIVTGCSHSGIVNIVEYAKIVCKNDKISAIIGGFHLFNDDVALIKKTVNELKKYDIGKVYPCHCTELLAKSELVQSFEVVEIGSGSQFIF